MVAVERTPRQLADLAAPPAERATRAEQRRAATGEQPAATAAAGEITALREELRRLAARVERLEGVAAIAAAGEEEIEGAEPPSPPAEALVPAVGSPARLALGGRLLLVLAGAFLLRAATESGQLPAALGVAIGLAYALAWLPAAHRAGTRGDGAGAAFHALAPLLIAYPLLFEAAARFHVLGAGSSALALAGITALLLHAGWRQHSAVVAWLTLLATIATATALALATGAPALFAALLVGLAGAGLLLGERRGWRPLGAASAAAAVFATAVVTAGTVVPYPLAPAAVLPVQLALLLLYLGFTAALAVRGQLPGWPLRTQTAAAVLVGWGGALIVGRVAGGALALATGVLGVLLAVAAEALALGSAAAVAPLRRLFLAAATVLFLGGTALLLPAPTSAWLAVAIVAVWVGARRASTSLELQGVLLAAAATVSGGALAAATAALLRPGTAPPRWPLVALLTLPAIVSCLPPLATGGRPRARARDVAVALLLALLAWMGSGALLALAAPAFAGDAGAAAACGTLLLSATTAAFAYAGRGGSFPAAGWLVYPLLAATTLKLLLVDLTPGRPLTLFVSLAALGSALLAAARAARRAR